MSCHVRAGGEPLAGGLGLKTPFGTIYSSNITSDKDTGIGAWTSDQFYRAMHDGIGAHGENLYPAFPYPWFRRVSREDTDAHVRLPADHAGRALHAARQRPALPAQHPLDGQGLEPAVPQVRHLPARSPRKSAEWNRGAYIVEGLGHCGACHTPKNMLGADKSGQDFHGGTARQLGGARPDRQRAHRPWRMERRGHRRTTCTPAATRAPAPAGRWPTS